MKSLILLAIFLLASDWPRPSASWPAPQQIDEASQNNLFQGMLDQELVNPVPVEANQQIAPIQSQEVINQAQEIQQQHQTGELAKVKENQQEAINQVQQPAEKVEQVKTLNFKRPVSNPDTWRTAEQQDHFARDNQIMYDELRNVHQNQPTQQSQIFHQSNNQAEDQVHQQIETPSVREASVLTNKELNFQIAKPDLVNTIGVNAIKKEAERVVSERKNAEKVETLSKKTDQTNEAETNESVKTLSYSPYYSPSYQGGAGYQPSKGPKTYSSYGREAEKAAASKKGKTNYDALDGNFKNLIIIANTNLNSNLGISSIDADLVRSFLSQFVGRSIESLIKDYEFSKLVDKFNKARSKSDNSYSDKSYEYTNKLSANVPNQENTGNSSSSSHSESTILLKKSDGTESTKNLGYGQPSSDIPYSYIPNENGGVIFINNKNDNKNLREVVEAVLGGKGKNVGEYDSGVVLPIKHAIMEKLLDNATIITNDNSNHNSY